MVNSYIRHRIKTSAKWNIDITKAAELYVASHGILGKNYRQVDRFTLRVYEAWMTVNNISMIEKEAATYKRAWDLASPELKTKENKNDKSDNSEENSENKTGNEKSVDDKDKIDEQNSQGNDNHDDSNQINGDKDEIQRNHESKKKRKEKIIISESEFLKEYLSQDFIENAYFYFIILDGYIKSGYSKSTMESLCARFSTYYPNFKIQRIKILPQHFAGRWKLDAYIKQILLPFQYNNYKDNLEMKSNITHSNSFDISEDDSNPDLYRNIGLPNENIKNSERGEWYVSLFKLGDLDEFQNEEIVNLFLKLILEHRDINDEICNLGSKQHPTNSQISQSPSASQTISENDNLKKQEINQLTANNKQTIQFLLDKDGDINYSFKHFLWVTLKFVCGETTGTQLLEKLDRNSKNKKSNKNNKSNKSNKSMIKIEVFQPEKYDSDTEFEDALRGPYTLIAKDSCNNLKDYFPFELKPMIQIAKFIMQKFPNIRDKTHDSVDTFKIKFFKDNNFGDGIMLSQILKRYKCKNIQVDGFNQIDTIGNNLITKFWEVSEDIRCKCANETNENDFLTFQPKDDESLDILIFSENSVRQKINFKLLYLAIKYKTKYLICEENTKDVLNNYFFHEEPLTTNKNWIIIFNKAKNKYGFQDKSIIFALNLLTWTDNERGIILEKLTCWLQSIYTDDISVLFGYHGKKNHFDPKQEYGKKILELLPQIVLNVSLPIKRFAINIELLKGDDDFTRIWNVKLANGGKVEFSLGVLGRDIQIQLKSMETDTSTINRLISKEFHQLFDDKWCENPWAINTPKVYDHLEFFSIRQKSEEDMQKLKLKELQSDEDNDEDEDEDDTGNDHDEDVNDEDEDEDEHDEDNNEDEEDINNEDFNENFNKAKNHDIFKEKKREKRKRKHILIFNDETSSMKKHKINIKE